MLKKGVKAAREAATKNGGYDGVVAKQKKRDELNMAMKQALQNIQSGEYAKKFILEGQTNYPEMTARRRLNAAHPIEQVGGKLRSMMPWITANALVDKSKN